MYKKTERVENAVIFLIGGADVFSIFMEREYENITRVNCLRFIDIQPFSKMVILVSLEGMSLS